MKIRANKLADIYGIIEGMPRTRIGLRFVKCGIGNAIRQGDVSAMTAGHVCTYLAFLPMFSPERLTVGAIRTVAQSLAKLNADLFGAEGASRYDADIKTTSAKERILRRIQARIESMNVDAAPAPIKRAPAPIKRAPAASTAVPTVQRASVASEAFVTRVVKTAVKSEPEQIAVPTPVAVFDTPPPIGPFKPTPGYRNVTDTTFKPSPTPSREGLKKNVVYIELRGRWHACE